MTVGELVKILKIHHCDTQILLDMPHMDEYGTVEQTFLARDSLILSAVARGDDV